MAAKLDMAGYDAIIIDPDIIAHLAAEPMERHAAAYLRVFANFCQAK